MSPRAVIVAHRSLMVAQGIAAALDRHPDILTLGVAVTAEDAVHRGEKAHAVALDEDLPGSGAAARSLRRKGIRVVMIGDVSDGDEQARVSASSPIATLKQALISDFDGASSPHRPNPRGDRGGRLTPREREVLSFVTKGFSAKQVARHLGISPKTVEQHKTRIFAKLEVPNQTAAAFVAMNGGRHGNTWIRSSS